MLTQTAKYAIRALMYLAQHEEEGYSQTRQIAQTINVPPNYLGKTLQKLAHARLLDSQKGLHGGFRAARPADQITMYEILMAIEVIPRDFAEAATADEGDDFPSNIYARFAEMGRMYADLLKGTTLADLMASVPMTVGV